MRVPYKILTRVPLPASSEDGKVCDLHLRADEVLGYSLLKRRDQLAETLQQLGIRPFSERSVEAFKQEISSMHNFYVDLYEKGFVVFCISAGLTLLCLIPAIAGWFISWKIGLGFTVPAVIGVIGMAYFMNHETYVTYDTPTWKQTYLRGYTNEVPEFALQQAIEIATILPQASFEVHELDLQRVRKSLVHLMSVTQAGQERFFFAAWSEPSLNARSMA
jgi:hypothetical protein